MLRTFTPRGHRAARESCLTPRIFPVRPRRMGVTCPARTKLSAKRSTRKWISPRSSPMGRGLKRITTEGGYTYAAFSPDGNSILHRRIQGALSQIFVMKADDTGDHNVSGDANLDGWPAWSPDGKRIVFSRRVSDNFQLFVMNRDGSGARQLTDTAGKFVNPRWSPDGSKILCSRRLGDMNLVIFPAPK